MVEKQKDMFVKWHGEWFKVVNEELIQNFMEVEKKLTIENEELTTEIFEYEIEETKN